MDEKRINNLAEKILKGTINEQEKKELDTWYSSVDDLEQIVDTDADQVELGSRMFNQIAQSANLKTFGNHQRKVISWPRIAAAASILMFLSLGGYFILHKNQSITQQTAQNQFNDISPGANSATLTLGNGQKLKLNNQLNGQLALQGNVAVTKIANGQIRYQVSSANTAEVLMNTVTTRRKEQYNIVLADGTHVWLNAGSSITYPTAFTGKTRSVSITGEAYFEVAHNAKKPFKVSTQGQTVEVLGTHFNINAYTDEPNVKTTLLQGSVKVTGKYSSQIIKPGQQATFTKDKLSVAEANTEETVAWKNGYFRFNGEKIESIMRKLSRWYDIDVEFKGPVPDDELDGTISRFKNISDVLYALEYSKIVHFKLEGRRVIVSK